MESSDLCNNLGFPVAVAIHVQSILGQALPEDQMGYFIDAAERLWPQVEAKLGEDFTISQLEGAVEVSEAVSGYAYSVADALIKIVQEATEEAGDVE